jgi:DNA-binding SARP family transcriptional activator
MPVSVPSGPVEFRILGPLEVVDHDGRDVPLPAAKPRALLALLLLHRNRVVSQDALIDDLWEERPPATAVKTLQVYVSQLRRALGDRRIETRPGGYVLHVEQGELDADAFEQRVSEKRWTDALELWRGPAFADVRSERFALVAAERLEEARLAALEGRIDADLDAGGHAALVGELEQLAEKHPLRERLRAQLMLALYRSGRQAEALEVYRRTRERLADELGLEPGVELRELEQAILRQDPALRRPTAAPAHAASGARRVWLLPIVVLLGIGVAISAVLATRPKQHTTGDLRTFVVKVENVLTQARDGRLAVAHAVDQALSCKIAGIQAAAQIEDVIANRNSLLDQIAALNVPDDDRARRTASLLQQASAASFAADVGYRRALLAARRCPAKLDRGATARADRLKGEFVLVFNPLASRFHLKTWSPEDF